MAIEKVTISVGNEEAKLQPAGNNQYAAEIEAPSRQLRTNEKTSYYSLSVRAEDDSGNMTTDNSQKLEVYEKNIFPQKMISATSIGQEMGFLPDVDIDIDVGDTNDFELLIGMDNWKKENLWYGFRIYIPGTEYGGLIEDLEVSTSEKTIYFRGHTWRGLLTQKIVEPPSGEDYLVLSGELNELIRELIGERFGSLFIADYADSGVSVSNWQVDRYVTLYDAITKLLDKNGHRLQITYKQGNGNEYGNVYLQAVPIKDWSDELEYSQDSRLNFRIRDCHTGINHLICLGSGELKERLVLHLYVQEDGNAGNTQFYTGISERAAVYDFSSEDDAEKLEESGRERLKELQNYKKIEITIDDVDVEIGDIVGGRERITGTYLKKPVVRKNLNMSNGNTTISYKVKGDD